ncbi:MAG: glycosyltransferase [Trichodesmium sp. MAG_R04]|jgi:glycosyltransferase involved in cell wall biosynthesis|nr:glycosyltransferase [Trichodesmium sp. MAG_R04]
MKIHNDNLVLETLDSKLKVKEVTNFRDMISILFILPVQGGSGGAHSVVQESLELHRYGVKVKIAVLEGRYSKFLGNYKEIPEISQIVASYRNIDELKKLAQNFSVVCATIYHTAIELEEIIKENPEILPAYYIQDYEPFFFPVKSQKWEEAEKSYKRIPNAVLFAKTQWLCSMISQRHGLKVYKVEPSIDHEVFYPSLRQTNSSRRVSAMVRFSTKRRAPSRTLQIANILSDLFADKVSFVLFGSSSEELESYGIPIPSNAEVMGVLSRSGVASVLRESDIFLDLSDYQAFGRTALEAMACGCVAVVPKCGGADEFAVPYVNSLVVDTLSDRDCVSKIAELIATDSETLFKIKLNAIETASRYSKKRAALSIFNLLYNKLLQKRRENSGLVNYSTVKKADNKRIKVAALLPCRSDIVAFSGSSYIRVVEPYQVLNQDKIDFCIEDEDSLIAKLAREEDKSSSKVDVVVVQRNAIAKQEVASKILHLVQTRNCKLIYEIDDNLFDTVDTSSSPTLQEQLQAMTILCRGAHIVTTSTPTLAQKLKSFNKNVVVLPNVLSDNLWKLNETKEPISASLKTPVKLLYMGTRTHFEDFKIIEPALERLKEERGDKLEIYFLGICHPRKAPKWIDYLKPPLGVDLYPHFVNWLLSNNVWDIGLAPLADNSLNRSKSYLKFLDYTGLGIPSICSVSETFSPIIRHKINGLLVENRANDWYEGITSLLDSPQLRASLAQAAFDELLVDHTLKTKSFNWLSVVHQVMGLKSSSIDF